MPNRAQRRASGARYPTSLGSWDHNAVLRGLEPPPGADGKAWKADFRIPDFAEFAARGDIPNPLASLAMQISEAGNGAVITEQSSPEVVDGFLDLQAHVIAANLVRPDLVKMCGSLEAAAALVRTKWTEAQKWFFWSHSVHVFNAADLNEAGERMASLLALSKSDRLGGDPSVGDSLGARRAEAV